MADFRRHHQSWAGMPVAVLLGVGALAGAGLAYYLSRGSQPQLKRLGEQARRALPEAVSRATGTLEEIRDALGRDSEQLDEAALQAGAELAVRGAAGAEEVQVGVEGRTVYLRGTVPTPGAMDQVLSRTKEVRGVVAVINMASVAAPKTAG